MFENVFETVNSGFAQALYEEYLRDPSSVPTEWKALFDSGVVGEKPAKGRTDGQADKRTDAGSAGNGSGREDEKTSGREGEKARGREGDGDHAAVPEGAEPIKGPALRLLKNMEESLQLPTATSFREIEVTALWNYRAALNGELKSRDIKLSFTHLIGWALVQAVESHPSMVHSVIEVGDEPHRMSPDSVNLGLAVDVERKDGSRGLMVPIIKGAESMDFKEFHAEYERLVAGARDSKLMPDAYMGGTMTLTNPGTIGTVASVPRLMKGQGSIIATGAIRTIAGARTMTMTSTYDHRIIQGAESGLFLQTVDKLLQGEDGFYQDIADSMGVKIAATASGSPSSGAKPSPAPATGSTGRTATNADLAHVAAAMSLVKAHRTHGHLAANLDPLGTEPPGDPALDADKLGLDDNALRSIPAHILRTYVAGETLADALPNLKATYCGTIAYEIEHISDHEQRVWLRQVIESGDHRRPMTPEARRRLLEDLTRVDRLEAFLHKAYLGHKRFGVEGLDSLIPMLKHAIELAGDQGAADVVMGMAHRGRLNTLAHIVGVSYETLLAEFEGGRRVEETMAPRGGTGDVKYHHGATGEMTSSNGRKVGITLLPNPSHLEAVDPVVEGSTRAKQSDRSGPTVSVNRESVLPILIHGDAAFAGQGVVAETLNLARLPGYSTGGTLHIIANNQVGFTTRPSDGRSTYYSSDLALGFDMPIVHVNADDPEACLAAINLAMMVRRQFGLGTVIDLVGYRRHGHNEGDEPRFTQPEMYRRIDEHPTVRELYGERLASDGVLTKEDAESIAQDRYDELAAVQDRLKEELAREDRGEEPDRMSGMFKLDQPRTSVDRDHLLQLNQRLVELPDGFNLNKKLKRLLDKRSSATDDEPSIDWGHAEALAFASLLDEGVPIRMSGQDSERGTFSHRHAVLHDAESGEIHVPLQNLPDQKASFELYNSPLSEYAVLGFEYGYAVADQKTLVLWEAQFGDFANGAEVIIDQFIIAGLSKWGQTSRLTMLLPHGYEGQGPEHSSARLERFLALGAENNIRVANCSTPAQYFHLLRRQGLIEEVRPLVVMTPKSLLRLPQAASRLQQFVEGEFQPVMDDDTLPSEPDDVSRLVFCSGKVYYDLVAADARADAKHVAISRIELLYPFPDEEVKDQLARYPNLKEVIWLQEEPANMGARKWVIPKLRFLCEESVNVRWISREERSSPAEGYPAMHKREQDRIVSEALA